MTLLPNELRTSQYPHLLLKSNTTMVHGSTPVSVDHTVYCTWIFFLIRNQNAQQLQKSGMIRLALGMGHLLLFHSLLPSCSEQGIFTTGVEKCKSYRRPTVHTARRFRRTPKDMRSFVSGKDTDQLRSGASSNYGFSDHESLTNHRTSL